MELAKRAEGSTNPAAGAGYEPVCPAVAEGATPAGGSPPHREGIVKMRDLTPKPFLSR
jgi:hypothetical protein